MSLENEEFNFFEEASSLIYKWLSEEERMQLRRELYSEEVGSIEELRPELRFLRLLHFIQVKYIKVENWANRISDLLEVFRSKNQRLFIEDTVFKDANGEDVSLMELREKLGEASPKATFSAFLLLITMLKPSLARTRAMLLPAPPFVLPATMATFLSFT